MNNSLETKIIDAAHSVEPSVEFSEKLWKQISSSSKPVSTSRGFSRWFWIPASAVLTLALVFFLIGPQNVAAAFRSLLAYLPGIGFVQNDESTLYLSNPVSVEQEGVTLTIEQVVADANNTIVSYRIDGLPVDASTGVSSCFYDDNRLMLPDGKVSLPTGGGVTNNLARIEFAPLPVGVTQATLLVGMNFDDGTCSAPKEWKVEFSLGTTPPALEMLPVVESAATASSSSDSQTTTVSDSTDSSVQFVVDKTVAMNDGYLLNGHIEWTNENWQNVQIDMENIHAVDAAGNPVPLEPSQEGTEDNEFEFKVQGKEFSAPLTLNVQNLYVEGNTESSSEFSFDSGSDPQVGQSWVLNQELMVAGKKITLESVQAIQETAASNSDTPAEGYAFEISTSDHADGFIICTGQEQGSDSWGQTMPVDDVQKRMEVYFPKGRPSGQVSCRFGSFSFQQHGSWQFDWQPPSSAQ